MAEPTNDSVQDATASGLVTTNTNLPNLGHIKMCFACNNPSSQRCAGCQNAQYCSKTCQKADWRLHQALCKPFSNSPERPGPNYYRGLLFPADEPRPRFIWVEHSGPLWYDIDPQAYLSNYSANHLSSDRYRPLHRVLGHNISLWYNNNFYGDSSLVNKSLKKWLGPEVAPAWRGSFLAQAYDGDLGEEGGGPLDIDTSALAPIVDFLKFRATYQGLGYKFNSDESEADASLMKWAKTF